MVPTQRYQHIAILAALQPADHLLHEHGAELGLALVAVHADLHPLQRHQRLLLGDIYVLSLAGE